MRRRSGRCPVMRRLGGDCVWMAGAGAIYYLSARRAVSDVMHEAEELQEELDHEPM